jgi:hypothetical protein
MLGIVMNGAWLLLVKCYWAALSVVDVVSVAVGYRFAVICWICYVLPLVNIDVVDASSCH